MTLKICGDICKNLHPRLFPAIIFIATLLTLLADKIWYGPLGFGQGLNDWALTHNIDFEANASGLTYMVILLVRILYVVAIERFYNLGGLAGLALLYLVINGLNLIESLFVGLSAGAICDDLASSFLLYAIVLGVILVCKRFAR